jgi:hypothetical protein
MLLVQFEKSPKRLRADVPVRRKRAKLASGLVAGML